MVTLFPVLIRVFSFQLIRKGEKKALQVVHKQDRVTILVASDQLVMYESNGYLSAICIIKLHRYSEVLYRGLIEHSLYT